MAYDKLPEEQKPSPITHEIPLNQQTNSTQEPSKNNPKRDLNKEREILEWYEEKYKRKDNMIPKRTFEASNTEMY